MSQIWQEYAWNLALFTHFLTHSHSPGFSSGAESIRVLSCFKDLHETCIPRHFRSSFVWYLSLTMFLQAFSCPWFSLREKERQNYERKVILWIRIIANNFDLIKTYMFVPSKVDEVYSFVSQINIYSNTRQVLQLKIVKRRLHDVNIETDLFRIFKTRPWNLISQRNVIVSRNKNIRKNIPKWKF